MKKSLIVVLTLALLLSMTACGGGSTAETVQPDDMPTVSDTQTESTPPTVPADDEQEQDKQEQPAELEEKPVEQEPTPIPEQTTDPEPSVEPTPAPEVKPEQTVTPEPEQEPAPVVKPEPTPEQTVAPTPTPEPAPETEPEQPVVTPEPAPVENPYIGFSVTSDIDVDREAFLHFAENELGKSASVANQLYFEKLSEVRGYFISNGLNLSQVPSIFEVLTGLNYTEYISANNLTTEDENQTTVVGAQTWVEGQKHDMPKEGDIIITADGTKHTITRDPISGVLGGGLDVTYDIWAGYTGLGNPWTDAKGRTNFGYVHGYDNGITGRDQTSLIKDPISNQTHSGSEWARISMSYRPSHKGEYEGQVANNWYQWHTDINKWVWHGPVGT